MDMQINSSNINFTSRNLVIRKADDIARNVNQVFPRVSLSNIRGFKDFRNGSFLKIQLTTRINRVRSQKSYYFDNASRYIEKALAFFVPVENYKVGNCSEAAQITVIAAKMNGIKDAKLMTLRDNMGRSLDHAVCYVENEGKPYVIDSWLGIADYVPNMLEKYNGIYKNKFKFGKLTKKQMHFSFNMEDTYALFSRKEIPEADLEKLKMLYPKLLVK